MNVLFHTTTAIGIAVLLTDTKSLQEEAHFSKSLWTGVSAFAVGVISHGALDYVPHCYPINSKADVIAGVAMISGMLWLVRQPYRLIIGLAFLGSIFPDLVDLLPAILNKHTGLNLPAAEKLFPWHWHQYSGSIYSEDCDVSTINHILLIVVVILICWQRRIDLMRMINLK